MLARTPIGGAVLRAIAEWAWLEPEAPEMEAVAPAPDPALRHDGLGRIGPMPVAGQLHLPFLCEQASGLGIRFEHRNLLSD